MSTWPVMSAAYAVRGSPAAPNGTLRDPPVGRAREDRSPVLELVDVVRRLLAEDLDRVLVAEVVGALDGVERVLLGVVLGGVPERGVDPTLGRAGVAANRVDLGDHGHVRARVEGLDRGAHSRAARRRRRARRVLASTCVTLPDRLLRVRRGTTRRAKTARALVAARHRDRADRPRSAARAAPGAEPPALRRASPSARRGRTTETPPSSADGR